MLDADDQGGAGCFDDVVGDGVQFADLHDAFHLCEQPVYESEVAVGDSGNGGQGLGVGGTEAFGFINDKQFNVFESHSW